MIPSSSTQWSQQLALQGISALFFGAAQATVIIYYPLLLMAKFEISQAVVQRSFSSLGLGYLFGAIAVRFIHHRHATDD